MKTSLISGSVLYILCAVLTFFYTYYYSGLYKSTTRESRRDYFWFALITSFIPLISTIITIVAIRDWWQRYRPIKDGHRVMLIKPDEDSVYIPTGTKGVVVRAYRALNTYHVDFGWDGHCVATCVTREQIRRV